MKIPRAAVLALAAGLLLTSLGCGTIRDLGGRANQTRQTAEAGIAQARAFATQSAEIIGTAQAFATQNPALVGTAQAFFTEQGPALLATAQAVATQYPGLMETAQALATQGLPQNSPALDIPMLPGENQLLVSTPDTLSYSTPADMSTVLDFYRTEMPRQGWNPVAQGTLETENVAVLNYVRGEQSASLTINPVSGQTIVTINLR
jgi:hypothetical protein